jgi:hypothetical protein
VGEADGVVAQDAGGQPLVGDDRPRVAACSQPRVGQRHVLHGPGLVLEGHDVADAQRLRDRQHDAGHGVGQHLPGGEADDGRRQRARRQHRPGQAVEVRELRDRQRDAHHDDEGLDRAA